MTSLRSRLIRLASTNPNLRQHLLPILGTEKVAATNENTVYLRDGAYVTNEDGQVIIYTSNGIRRENEVWIEDVPLLIRALQKLSR